MIWSADLSNAIRFLSIDAVEQAKSGHPGMPLGMADIATVLWRGFLNHAPHNPAWFNRDRFVLSNGHGSMLLYALLHLTGYALTLDDLKGFRQLHSKTPGHPEFRHTPGVETTTGPLGQGLANAVGMAIAEKHLAARFNRPGLALIDHYTYVFIGDGCLMEGISHEVCSLAGTLQLSKLIVFYDDNGISIDGEVDAWFTEDIPQRFQAYGWHVSGLIDGHDPIAVERAIEAAKAAPQPSLIRCRTVIGLGAPQAGTADAHGAPLGEAALDQARRFFQWPYPPFEIPAFLYEQWDAKPTGHDKERAWLAICQAYQQHYPAEYRQFLQQSNGDLPDHWEQLVEDHLKACQLITKPMATRQASQACIAYWAAHLPALMGGSADLTGSNLTDWPEALPFNAMTPEGRYLHYGVREFGMSAIMNGLALHGGVIPFGGTFLVFADYARNALRLSALMGIRVIYVLTHDSIGLGEDGPTHQPIEHAWMLRMTPRMHVWRPADLLETAVAWSEALVRHDGPTCLLLSRQAFPAITADQAECAQMIRKGGYIVVETEGCPEAIFIATGSEVHLAVAAAAEIKAKSGAQVRVVSMPCVEVFLAQDPIYQLEVLPPAVTQRLAVEAGATAGWYRLVGLEGQVLGLEDFGVSAKGSDAFRHFGLTVDAMVAWGLQAIERRL